MKWIRFTDQCPEDGDDIVVWGKEEGFHTEKICQGDAGLYFFWTGVDLDEGTYSHWFKLETPDEEMTRINQSILECLCGHRPFIQLTQGTPASWVTECPSCKRSVSRPSWDNIETVISEWNAKILTKMYSSRGTPE